MSDDADAEALAGHVSTIIKALLVAGRQGAPAEGKIAFNPLHFHMLRMLNEAVSLRPSEIADDLSVPRTTVSAAVKALHKRGLVTSAPDARDGRAITLALSAEGQAVTEAIIRQDQRNAQAMLAALEPAERAAFVRTLGKVAGGLGGLKQTDGADGAQ